VKKTLKQISEEGVILLNEEGKEEGVPADWIIMALGVKPDDSISRKLEGKVPELYGIGDSCQIGKIMEAAYDGARVARLI